MVKKQIYSQGLEYYVNHLTLISPMLPEDKQLSPTEKEVLAAFMFVFDSSIYEYHVTFETKKKVKALLNLSSSSMSMYIAKLSKLQYLQKIDDTKDYNILSSIIPDPKQEKYLIVLHKINI